MVQKVAGESRKGWSKPVPVARPAPQYLSNYKPTIGDRLAWKLSDWFGGSGENRKASTEYFRNKVNPLVPGVAQVEAWKNVKGNVKAGNYGTAALDVALETPVGKGAKVAAPVLGTFIGPMAKSWNREMAKKAIELGKKGVPWDEIWDQTKTAFHKVGESKTQGSRGKLAPMQEVSSRPMKIDPDIRYNLPPEAWIGDTATPLKPGIPIKEFIKEHPLWDEYPGLKEKPTWYDVAGNTGSMIGKSGGSGMDRIVGFTFNPNQLAFGQTTDIPGNILHAQDRGMHTLSFPETIEHELQHAVSKIEGWPGGGIGDWKDEPLRVGGILPGSPEEHLGGHLLGSWGKQRYPGIPDEDRLQFGFYQSDVDEALARNAGRRASLDAGSRAAIDPVSTYDMPFHLQQLARIVKKRTEDVLAGLLKP